MEDTNNQQCIVRFVCCELCRHNNDDTGDDTGDNRWIHARHNRASARVTK